MTPSVDCLPASFSAIVVEWLVILAFCALAWRAVLALRGYLLQQKNSWLSLFAGTFFIPMVTAITGFGLLFALERTAIRLGVGSSLPWGQGRLVLGIAVVTWIFMRWSAKLEDHLLKRAKTKDARALIRTVHRLVLIAVLVLMAMVTLATLGLDIAPLLAVGSIGTLAVSWAAKDIIANFLSGLMIYINRPFSVGDWISSPNKKFEGTVEELGWYMTRIRTFARRPMYIPNAILIDAIVENPGRMYNRRVLATIGIRYEDMSKMRQITKDIRSYIDRHPEIDQRQVKLVHFKNFGAYSIDIQVYTFLKTTNWAEYLDIQQEIFLDIADLIAKRGAEIAFPTQNVLLSGPEELCQSKDERV